MRITRLAKRETRERILKAARRLFAQQGFEETTTRDIAGSAQIAAGTLFNYFPTKEAIVVTLVGEALAQSRADFERDRRRGASLEEDLFAHVAAGLRRMKPLRRFLQPALETAWNAAAAARPGLDGTVADVRGDHLEFTRRLFAAHGVEADSVLVVQLYWTLFTGVLGFWTRDSSPKQEDTLALLDQSIAMFTGWFRTAARTDEGRGTRDNGE